MELNDLITSQQFEAAFKSSIDFAETRIGDKPDEIIPYLLIHYREEQPDGSIGDIAIAMCALAVELITWEDKVNMMRGLGGRCYRDRHVPVAVFFVAEALQNRQTPKPGDKIVQPVDDPNSKECMIVMGQQVKVNFTVGCTVPLERNEAGLYKRRGPNVMSRNMDSPLLREFWIGFAIAAMAGNMPPTPPHDDEEGEEWKKG